jgi:hypothetical protein
MNPKHKDIETREIEETGDQTIPVNDKRRFNDKGERVAEDEKPNES